MNIAHQMGLKPIDTNSLQVTSLKNGHIALFKSRVVFENGIIWSAIEDVTSVNAPSGWHVLLFELQV